MLAIGRSRAKLALSTLRAVIALAFLLAIAGLWKHAEPGVTAAPAGTIHYPDLQTILPPGDFSIAAIAGGRELRYTHHTANFGDGPLEVRMQYAAATDTARPFQRLYTHNASNVFSLVSEIPVVGTFQYHPAHGHYHFPLASFGLFNVGPGDTVGSVALMSPKIGFCLGDSTKEDSSLPHANAFSYSGGSCSTPTLNEGISVGSSDIYDLNDAGQSINLAGLPAGDYWFRATSDPYNYFTEKDETNNITEQKLRIPATGTALVVLGAQRHPNSQPPTVALTSPPAGVVSGTAVALAASATDPSGITSLQFLLDGFPAGPLLVAPPYSMVWDSTTTVNGAHYLSAQARAGTTFIGTAPAVVVNVANSGPPGPPLPGSPTVGTSVTINATTNPATTPQFSTAGTGQLLIAFVSADGPAGQAATVSGAGLTWSRVNQTNARPGTSEIWQARAANQLTNVAVTSTLASGGVHQSLTVVSFVNAVVGASNGASGPIDAIPAVSLTTTQPLSTVYGVGNDPDRALARGVASGQTLVQQWIDTNAGATFWVQALANAITAAGTPVQLVDNSPITSQWNFSAVELAPQVINSDVIVTNRTATSATVVWTTNVPATSRIRYGTTPTYGSLATNAALVTNHQLTLVGLQPETTYHYEITSQNATGQSAGTADFVFSTAAVSEITSVMTAPGDGAAVSGLVTVVADAHSTASIAGVQFFLDNMPLGAEVTGVSFSVPWDTTTATTGRHVLTAIARDPTGNTATAAPVVVMVEGGLTPAGVVTQHNDNARTGANLAELNLTTSNVNAGRFGKLFERAVDDQIYGQPLYVPNVDVSGTGVRNVVYVATVNDSVYAFDADNPAASSPLWQVSYVNPAAGIVPGNRTDIACDNISGNIGIVSTPVIDPVTQTMYLVARTKENGNFVQRLHAVDIRDGSERPGSPTVIQAANFSSQMENQRAALLLANGVVYIAWASYCDTTPYHGWIIGYDTLTLLPVMVFNSTPGGPQGGIWQSGQGLSADADGNIYAMTGNGAFDGLQNFGNSFLKLTPNGALLDWFTPNNWSALNDADLDLGSQGPVPLPDTNLLVGGGKQGIFYVLDRANLGHVQSGSDSQIVQSFAVSSPPVRLDASPVFWNQPGGPTLYVWPGGDRLKAYRLVNGPPQLFQTTPVSQSAASSGGAPGGVLSLSANGSAPVTGIIWANLSNGGPALTSTQPGILRAYNAGDLTQELWNSGQNPARDALGNFAKHSAPTIANGKVYVATFSNKLVVYGLLPVSGLVVVPNVVNATQAAATTTITSAGLAIGTVGNAPSASVPAGSVASQNPIAGSQVSLGSAVNLVISSGPQLATVPNVVNATQAAATAAITAAGLVVGTVDSAPSGTVPAGSVISENPAAGTQVAANTAVNLVVSSGQPIIVPSVVNLTQPAAATAITGAGLVVGTVTLASSATVPSGTVISQSPGAGTQVLAGSAVNLVVSTGSSALSVDKVVFSDGSGTRTISGFSTAAAGELLVAFAASDGPTAGQTLTVSGAGLAWTLVRRMNTQAGTSEIWSATASAMLANASVTCTQGTGGFQMSLTLVAFAGAGGVGANASASAASGQPTVSLTTTQPGSFLYGVGNDYDNALARTPGASQTLVHQYLAPSGDTMWVQNRVGSIASAGTIVSINDTAPTTDRWNLAAAEILAASQAVPVGVPNVVSLTQAAATTAITGAGLVVGTVSNATSVTVPAGSVISQTPSAGAQVAPGTAVNLVISVGPPVPVPNIVNATQVDATSALLGVGLVVGTVSSAPSATVPAGSVSSQNPNAGAQVAPGSAVSFVVSTGPAPVTVPTVVNLTQSAATNAITGAGLVVGTIGNAPSSTIAAGSVISQNPSAGAQVAPGTAVNLVVSTGPAPVSVPSVVNLTQSAATNVISGAGLVVGTIGNASSATIAAGSVISQNPSAGTQVAPGTAVNLVISTGPPPVAVPNIVGITQPVASSSIAAAGLTVGTVTNASSATVPPGLVISQNPNAGTLAAPGSAVSFVVSTGPPPAGITVGSVVFSDGRDTRTTPSFSSPAGAVLLAFVAADGPTSAATPQTATVSGAGQTWTLVRRVNVRPGTSEIWRAISTAAVTNGTVTAALQRSGFDASLTVVSFIGATGTGASAGNNAASGAPTVALVTTGAGSLVYGVGNDWDRAVARTVGATQTMVHQWVDTGVGDTFWVQSRTGAVAATATSVTLNDTAPINDRWNFASVEIVR